LTPELRRTRLSARTQAGSSRGCGERGPRFPEALGHAANHQSQKEVGRDTTVDDARHGAAALALPVAAGGSSGGLSPKQLGDAGWTCFNVPGLGVHCAPPGQAWPPTEPVVQLLYFFNTTDPSSSVPDFTGTETQSGRRLQRAAVPDPAGRELHRSQFPRTELLGLPPPLGVKLGEVTQVAPPPTDFTPQAPTAPSRREER